MGKEFHFKDRVHKSFRGITEQGFLHGDTTQIDEMISVLTLLKQKKKYYHRNLLELIGKPRSRFNATRFNTTLLNTPTK